NSDSSEARILLDWSRDGRFLIYAAAGRMVGSGRNWDLWIWPMQAARGEGGKAIPFLTTAASENNARLSPDGRWIVYTSDESGRSEVYVRLSPSSGGSGKWVVSTAGGFEPLWCRDGKEILYLAPNH